MSKVRFSIPKDELSGPLLKAIAARGEFAFLPGNDVVSFTVDTGSKQEDVFEMLKEIQGVEVFRYEIDPSVSLPTNKKALAAGVASALGYLKDMLSDPDGPENKGCAVWKHNVFASDEVRSQYQYDRSHVGIYSKSWIIPKLEIVLAALVGNQSGKAECKHYFDQNYFDKIGNEIEEALEIDYSQQ